MNLTNLCTIYLHNKFRNLIPLDLSRLKKYKDESL